MFKISLVDFVESILQIFSLFDVETSTTTQTFHLQTNGIYF